MAPTVTTVIIPEDEPLGPVPLGTWRHEYWLYAHNDDERRALAAKIRESLDGLRLTHCFVYSWDRPCRSMFQYTRDEDTGAAMWVSTGEDEFPAQNLVAVAGQGYGALCFQAGRARLVSVNPQPIAPGVVIPFDFGTTGAFPAQSVLPLDQVHAAVERYLLTGQRPDTITWASR